MLNEEAPLFSALATLGYDPAWLEWSFLDATFLQEQITAYQTGQDAHTEHYRYAAFRRVLSSRSALTEEEIERYLALAQMDADSKGMARSALVDLFTWLGLSAEQFESLSRRPVFAAPLFQKLALRRRLLSALASIT